MTGGSHLSRCKKQAEVIFVLILGKLPKSAGNALENRYTISYKFPESKHNSIWIYYICFLKNTHIPYYKNGIR
jgi:hypothetical protein